MPIEYLNAEAEVLGEIHTRFHSAYMAKIEEHDEFHAKHTLRLLHLATTPPSDHNKKHTQFIWRTSLLMLASRSPKSPPCTKCLNLRVLQPPLGFDNLNGQRKLDACSYLSAEENVYDMVVLTCLKLGPAVAIS